jgi:GDP-L-fucose synthase
VRVVIAGAKGLAGSALVREFSSSKYEVVEISRKNADLTNFSETLNIVREVKPQILINAAARVGGIAENDSYPVDFLLENLSIQNNLMNAANLMNVGKFVFLGSSCIYPRDCKQPIKEEYFMSGILEPTNSAYAIAKIAGIELINSFRKQFGRSWISVMPTNLYGPNDNFELLSSHVMPAMIRKFVEAVDGNESKVIFWGSGNPLREFLHVDDFAKAVHLATLEYDSNVLLNIGSGVEISISDLAQLISNLTGFKGDIFWDQSRLDGTPRKILDSTKLRNMGWSPKIDLTEGISAVIDWYRNSSSVKRSRS